MRIKTVGFEQQTLEPNSELFFVSGAPTFVTNIDPTTNNATVWDSLVGEWDSLTVPWSVVAGNAPYEPEGVRSGYFGLKMAVGDFFEVKASSKGGGGYNRIYVRLANYPDQNTGFISFRRDSDDEDMAVLEMGTDGRLRTYYRTDAGVQHYIGAASNVLQLGQWYAIELGIIGNQAGTTRTIEARVDHLRFMFATITDQSSYDGYFAIGSNLDGGTATTFDFYVDDLATNDAAGFDSNTWPGPGKVVLLPVTGDDELVGNFGWTRGGTDTGADWSQVAEVSPPVDGTSYLIGTTGGNVVDFRLGNPYSAGLQVNDRINIVVANVRWALANTSENANLLVYLRAGSALSREGREILLFGTDWRTADATGRAPDVFSTAHLPLTSLPWTLDDLSSARIGMEITDQTPDIYVTGMWAYVEYAPYDAQDTYTLTIGGVDRTGDIQKGSLVLSDILNEQANTLNLKMYNLANNPIPQEDEIIDLEVNGQRAFGGLVIRPGTLPLGNEQPIYTVSCVDFTRLLDRRLVSATYKNLTDKQIIELMASEFAPDDNITTYHVSEGVLVNQISFNYIPFTQAMKQLAALTQRSWFIDYYRDIHYFPLSESRAPFDITPNSQNHSNLKTTKDSSQVRNRVFVRGGTELTNSPITEAVIADGTQRQFLLAEKPHDTTITVNGVSKTLGIKNVDDPLSFDFLVNFQEKYIEVASAPVPTAGDNVAVTYNYDVPILVAVEDTASIAENAARSGGSGVFEHVIIDNQIASTQQARDRATAELTSYGRSMVDISYRTYHRGVSSGQYQRVTMPDAGLDDDYVVNTVTATSLGNGVFFYDVALTNLRTYSIISLLISLLQLDRTIGTIDPNEKVDQLFGLTDTLDSLVDSLTIDSAPTQFKWSNDAGTTPNKLKFNLGQWS